MAQNKGLEIKRLHIDDVIDLNLMIGCQVDLDLMIGRQLDLDPLILIRLTEKAEPLLGRQRRQAAPGAVLGTPESMP